MIDLDIIIVNYQSTDLVLSCIQSIHRQLDDITVQIFVEDNNSTDGIDRIHARYPDVRVNRNSKNIGFSAAVNQAVLRGRAPYVMLLNPDSIVQAGLFDRALTYLETHSDVGVLGPEIVDGDGKIQESARSFPTPFTALFGRQSLLSGIFPENRLTRANLMTGQSDGITPLPVDWVSGACMIVRRNAIETIGLLDERFFMYWEDADWCFRFQQNGWKVIYFPRAAVIHYTAKSSDKRPIGSAYAFHKSVFRYFQKHDQADRWYLYPVICFGLLVRFCLVSVMGWMRR